MWRFERISCLARLDTYCWTEGAFLRKTFWPLSGPTAFALEDPCGMDKREPLKEAASGGGGGGLGDAKLSRRTV